jgi:hypothetical protein
LNRSALRGKDKIAMVMASTHPFAWSSNHMATVLGKELKRQVTVEGAEYTVVIDPEGFRLTGKGKRRPQVELRWRDLLSGEAAMAVALNVSLSETRPPAKATVSQHGKKAAGTRGQ